MGLVHCCVLTALTKVLLVRIGGSKELSNDEGSEDRVSGV